MDLSSEAKLIDIRNQITLIYTDYDKNDTLSKRIVSYNKCMILIAEAKKLIEELQIKIVNINSNVKYATREQMKRANNLTMLLQIPGLTFDNLIQIVEEQRTISNSIPTTATVVENIEDGLWCDTTI